MTLKIEIDRDLCSGYANCLDAAPEVFDVDDKDIAIVIARAADLEAHRTAIERAVKLCPLNAITVVDED